MLLNDSYYSEDEEALAQPVTATFGTSKSASNLNNSLTPAQQDILAKSAQLAIEVKISDIKVREG